MTFAQQSSCQQHGSQFGFLLPHALSQKLQHGVSLVTKANVGRVLSLVSHLGHLRRVVSADLAHLRPDSLMSCAVQIATTNSAIDQSFNGNAFVCRYRAHALHPLTNSRRTYVECVGKGSLAPQNLASVFYGVHGVKL